MLGNTLILPESDARLAVRLLRDAVDALDVVLMLVFGKDDRATQVATWCDRLCNKTATPDGNLRHVVWIRDTSTTTVESAVAELIGDEPFPRAAVLNFFDEHRGSLTDDDRIDPIELEKLFLKGHLS